MRPVLIAQFLSALADNILLFVIIGLIKQQQMAEWAIPVLQQTFLVAYIVLAPFVGAVSDAFPKGRIMLLANTLKFFAVIFLLAGGNAFIVYGLVGVGACIYSPAKYGILKELKGEAFLVKANAMIESSTIVAILAGVVLGGVLADIAVEKDAFATIITVVAGVYLLASLSNLLIPKLKPAHRGKMHWGLLLQQFVRDFKTLWGDFSSRLTMLGTGLFFGVGATMRFLLVAWVPQALGIVDNTTPAEMNAVVAIGIVIGAGLASRIALKNAYRVVPSGLVMGVGIIMMSQMNSLHATYFWLVIIGIFGGLFLVPLNALLQKQGHDLVGGGHAIAIQNFVENIAMLVMLSLYIGLVKTGLSVVVIGVLFGGLVTALMLGLRLYAQRGISAGP